MKWSWLICFALIFTSGCSVLNDRATAEETAKYLIPVNAAVAYFGTVGVHEAGHALTAKALGADSVKVSLLPVREEGNFHFAYTTAYHKGWSKTEESLFNTMGLTASFLTHVGTRELLKTGYVPKMLQPTFAWLSLFNRGSFYFHALAGLARSKSTDLGKEDPWVSAVMLLGIVSYDVYDFLIDEGPTYKVLIGADFYEPKEDRLRFVSSLLPGGGFVGFEIKY